MRTVEEIGRAAKAASRELAGVSTQVKNAALERIAVSLEEHAAQVLLANQLDIEAARENGIADVMIDRLTLTEARIADIAGALRQLIALPDPVGEIIGGNTLPNGLQILKKRVPMGVIGIIYESRPNVTVDAATLCLKAGSACILKGGKEAIHSNLALAELMRQALSESGLPQDCICLIEDTARESTNQLMRLNGYLDVLIPRGGAGLIRAVVQNATVPVIETGTGNCHIFVDESADLDMAVSILVNAKTSRPSVCNAAESLLVHRAVAEKFLPMAQAQLSKFDVKLLGCARTREILHGVVPATSEDYAAEFLDYVLSVRVVESIDEAIEHIARFSTGHSECIVTSDYANSQRFVEQVDAAAVYVNASTRFTDGGEFGLGAEIGISTQKLHARGPMGLREMTTYKYVVLGDGQVR